ncbi:hypothetical protein AMATHDRAFT_149106 [Amanita thiersii Skay4041]|uniref:Uncharacterized protein n=1 Tax=Amanita thiersii Skay4041 TaxID=703135 RepID=A0A2A9NCN8_9AGAR|nr:hypothetical protein AMATHDRAFT_149106 [Amanita thiersii Skay4041]
MLLWKLFHYLLSGSWTFIPVPSPASLHPTTFPLNSCFAQAVTLQDIISCHLKYVIRMASYTKESYSAAQPTKEQRHAWSTAVSSLLQVDSNNTCASVSAALPGALKDIYAIFELTEPSGRTFCVFAENVAEHNTKYDKGWGILVVPSTRSAVSRHVHVSAPHPIHDFDTEKQAAEVFRGIGAKSLFIPGRDRRAFLEVTPCVPSMIRSKHFKTDPAYDKNETFFDTYRQIIHWQNQNGGCPSPSCAYVQFHGRNASTCRENQVFISTGLGEDPPSLEWYTNNETYPVKRIKSQLAAAFPSWNVALPSDSACNLVATTNIGGRLINGVNESDICTEEASAEHTLGQFVHVEQSSMSRSPDYYEAWVQVFLASFETSCAGGTVRNNTTGLCSPPER